MTIRVLVPTMPSPDELLPYLHAIHSRRVYVNGGPLVQALQERIGREIGLPCRMVSNGTVAIQLALQALRLRPRSLVAVPSVTFSGTGLAILAAGHVPVLCDVDPDTWQLRPDAVPENCDAALPVAAYGMPIDIGPWVAWAEARNRPVVVDAAGALLDQPTCSSRLILFAYSLHATKFIGAGEGGAVAGPEAMVDRVAALATFGHGGTNAKMSEYHAAVAMASMDTAQERCEAMAILRLRYIARLLRRPKGLQLQMPTTAHTGSWPWRGAPSLMPVLLPEDRMAVPAMMALGSVGIETRQWYRGFLHERSDMPALAGSLPVADLLVERLIGLPMHGHLTIADVDHVCHRLEVVCQ